MLQWLIRRIKTTGGDLAGVAPAAARRRSVLVACALLRLLLASLGAAIAPSSLTLAIGLGFPNAEVGGGAMSQARVHARACMLCPPYGF